MLDYSSDEYFVTLYNFKTEKRKYNFFQQTCSCQNSLQSTTFYYFVTTIYTHLLFTTMHFRSKQKITRGNYAWILME